MDCIALFRPLCRVRLSLPVNIALGEMFSLRTAALISFSNSMYEIKLKIWPIALRILNITTMIFLFNRIRDFRTEISAAVHNESKPLVTAIIFKIKIFQSVA